MKKKLLITTSVFIVLLFAGLFVLNKRTDVDDETHLSLPPTVAISQEVTPDFQNSPIPPSKKPVDSTNVKIAMIQLNTKGDIGCGDSILYVSRVVPSTEEVLKAALSELFSIKTQYYGQSGLYNSLYKSTLRADKIEIVDGIATVYISGTTSLGGECDDPRARAQIEQTVLQFPTIKSANIYINGKKIADYFSLKG